MLNFLLLAPSTDHKSHNAQRYTQTNRLTEWTDGRQDDANSRSYCVVVRRAKKHFTCVSMTADTLAYNPTFDLYLANKTANRYIMRARVRCLMTLAAY